MLVESLKMFEQIWDSERHKMEIFKTSIMSVVESQMEFEEKFQKMFEYQKGLIKSENNSRAGSESSYFGPIKAKHKST